MTCFEVDSWLKTTNFTSDDVGSYSSQWEQNTANADLDMESPTSDSTSQPASFLARRPVLVPTPPSTKRSGTGSRTPSPTRKILALLECARPSVRCRQPGNTVVQPDQVINLRKSIIKNRGLRVIPGALKVSIVAMHGVDHRLFRTRSFTDQTCRLACDKQTQTVSRTSLKACLTNPQGP